MGCLMFERFETVSNILKLLKRLIYGQNVRKNDRLTGGWMDKQNNIERQINRKNDRMKDRMTDRQIDEYTDRTIG